MWLYMFENGKTGEHGGARGSTGEHGNMKKKRPWTGDDEMFNVDHR